MPCPRRNILGRPDVYLVRMTCALAHPAFAVMDDAQAVLDLLQELGSGFRIRLYAYRIEAADVALVLRHDLTQAETDDSLRRRWTAMGGRSTGMTTTRLRRRLGSLDGFMQTLCQRASRDWNRRHLSRGHLWAGRYRTCLLADDAALLAGVIWCEDPDRGPVVVSSRGRHGAGMAPLLAALPLRIATGSMVFPSDESPPGCPPPADQDLQGCFIRYGEGLMPTCRTAYGMALTRGLALGRPESLSETMARLGRDGGRGRSRQLRDLDDQRGLCGVWG